MGSRPDHHSIKIEWLFGIPGEIWAVDGQVPSSPRAVLDEGGSSHLTYQWIAGAVSYPRAWVIRSSQLRDVQRAWQVVAGIVRSDYRPDKLMDPVLIGITREDPAYLVAISQ